MSTLAAAMPFLRRDEGGFSNNPADPGEATMCGVTLRTAQRLLGITTVEELKAITPAQLEIVYGSPDFWRYDGIKDQRVATKLFDIGVDIGLGTEVGICQKILGITVDHCYGPKTEAAINAADPDQLLSALCEAAKEYYISVAEKNPREGIFLNGWEFRAEEVPSA
jgi:lysozyme family protein